MFIIENRDRVSNYNEEFDHGNLKISIVSEVIHIHGNSGWTAFKAAGNCTGDGTYSNPYIIKDLVIDTGGFGIGILIENSNVYFKIENCTVYNSGGVLNAGINLLDVNNGQLINNTCSINYIGIYLRSCNNSTLLGNIVYDNNDGIALIASDVNMVSGNIADDNARYGIFLYGCDDTTVSGCTANGNAEGISLLINNETTVSGNIANNNSKGIYLDKSNNNTISENTAIDNSFGIYLDESSFNNASENNAYNNSYGIYLDDSNYNIISGNTLIGNDECIVEVNCQGNKFSDNGSCTYGQDSIEIPGYNLFLLFGIISVVAIITRTKIKKS